jgi:hypothetical protein
LKESVGSGLAQPAAFGIEIFEIETHRLSDPDSRRVEQADLCLAGEWLKGLGRIKLCRCSDAVC